MLKDLRLQKIFRNFVAETKVADGQPRTLVVKISSPTPDRSNDTVQPAGMNSDNFMKNPVVPFAHNYDDLPIAKCTGLKVSDTGILATVEFPQEGMYDKADTVYQMYKQGFLNAWSIGFMAKDYDENEAGGYNFKEWELLEFSSVPVPANPEALTIMRSKGINVDILVEKKTDEKEEIEKDAGDDDPDDVPDETPITELNVGQLRDILEDAFEDNDDDPDDEKAVKQIFAKDVNQVLALSYVLDCLDYFISYFKSNGVNEDDISKLTQALALVMEVTKSQAELGKKEFAISVLKSGRTISAQNEEKLKAAQDHMAQATQHVKDVLSSVADDGNDDDEENPEDKGITRKLYKQITAAQKQLKETDKSVGLTLRLFKSIQSEKGGEK